MNLTTDIWTGIGASRFGRDPTFAGRSRSSNMSRVQEDTRVSQTTARGVDYRERLGAGPATVGDATAGFGVSKPAITKHVKVLEETGVVTRAVAARAPQAELQKLKERHGWEHIPWYTITDDWDKDFGVDEWHGHNAFIREGDQIYRTYFIDSRGDEAMGTTWSYLDMAPLGRQEDWEDSPEDYPQTAPYGWWNYNDAYGA